MEETYYFLGIGGISMSSLARYFKRQGHHVSGYDRVSSPLTCTLESEGIPVHYEEDSSLIPKNPSMVIYTPAIPKTNTEWEYVLQQKYPLKKRAEVLGELTKGKKCIAVSGTHGKTTISSLIAFLFSESHQKSSAFLGGIANNFDSNLIVEKESDYIVVEADEYDRSFLQLHPFYSIVSSIEADHLDIYGSEDELVRGFEQFVSQTDAQGMLFYKKGVRMTLPRGCSVQSYGLQDSQADYFAQNINVEGYAYHFELHTPKGIIKDLRMTYPGLHNLENAVVAIAVSLQSGISPEEIRRALPLFTGVRRRFDFRIKREDMIFIDDYAHHPGEIEVLIKSVHHLFPGKKICGVFQPHLFSRTKDFMDGFAETLSALDTVVLLDIYPAREEPIEGVNSDVLLQKISNDDKHLLAKESLIPFLKERNPQILLTIGAGDIDKLVEPITKAFEDEN